jgi:glycosyltransferase involved in cell wall biosynthesis
MSQSGKLVSIVLSFRNEAANIPPMIDRLGKVFAGQPEEYEVIYINDASTDASLEVLRKERSRNPRVRVLNMSRRFGVTECVQAGMQVAAGDAIVYLDADLQDPPEVIPQMLEEWRRGADVVHTVRTRRLGENPIKMWLTSQAYRAIHFGSSIQLPLDAGDFKLLSRKAVDHLLSCREKDPYLRGLVVWVGFRQALVPYERAARFSGRTHFPLFSRNPWKTLITGLTSFSFMPVYACGVAAMCGLAAGLVLLAVAALMAVIGSAGAGLTALIGLGVFLWASAMCGVSIVGLYVVRIYKDVRGRPSYIVESSEGFERKG